MIFKGFTKKTAAILPFNVIAIRLLSGYISLMKLEKIANSRICRIVGAEPVGDGGACVFIRDGDSVRSETIDFRPFILLKSESILDGFAKKFEIEKLSGSAPLAFLARFKSKADYEDALKFLSSVTGFSPSSPSAPYRVISDLTTQLFISESFRLFSDMRFPDIRRMQFDIETVCTEGFDFPNPEREGDGIIIISMTDSTGWESRSSAENMSEKELLQEFVNTVKERDPDVLEGYNIFRFDLPFIEERAKRHKVKLGLGRDNSPMKKRNSRFSAAERTINYTRYDIYGRHIVDIYYLVQLYDVTHRNLDGYGLKEVAKHFGVAPKDRTYIDGREISKAWQNDRTRLLAYALDDARETRAVSDILSPSFFYQAQLVPMKYQDCAVRGNATRIDAILTAHYISMTESIPLPENGVPFTGALTKAFHSGVFENVWHCDVRSLYPSIILSCNLCPKRDTLGIFTKFLKTLREFRLEAKDAERSAETPAMKDYYNSLQTTFKILINSFYGYLGFSQGTFNDFAMAAEVTAKGRKILSSMLDFLNSQGAKVIEMDTDGIYFQPPPDQNSTSEMEKKIQSVLPPGIEVELDSTCKAMFCYKSKNYALLSDNGEISVTGAALKSRGLEPFQRDYIRQIIYLVLNEKFSEVNTFTEKYRQMINERAFPLEKLAKTETLSDSVEVYSKKISAGGGRRSAAYELAAASKRDYRRGDQVSFYVTGTKKNVSIFDNSRLLADAPPQRDENINYYLAKLDELYNKFSDFIPTGENRSAQMNFDFEMAEK